MNNFQFFINKIQKNLQKPLPGLAAQKKMVPPTRISDLTDYSVYSHARQSAVLILFYPERDNIFFILIKRAEYQGVHSGQIAFPGGQYEPNDTDLKTTALREASEEIGIIPEKVHILGHLTKVYIPPSHFLVTPFVGYTRQKPDFKIDKTETKEILPIQLSSFLDPQCQTTKTIQHRSGKEINVPCFYLNKKIVWGATAMILSELLNVIQKN